MRKTVTETQQPANGGETLASIVYNELLEDVLKGDHETDEHEAIRYAAIDRDADLAVELLTAQFNVTADIVMSSGTLTSRHHRAAAEPGNRYTRSHLAGC